MFPKWGGALNSLRNQRVPAGGSSKGRLRPHARPRPRVSHRTLSCLINATRPRPLWTPTDVGPLYYWRRTYLHPSIWHFWRNKDKCNASGYNKRGLPFKNSIHHHDRLVRKLPWESLIQTKNIRWQAVRKSTTTNFFIQNINLSYWCTYAGWFDKKSQLP